MRGGGRIAFLGGVGGGVGGCQGTSHPIENQTIDEGDTYTSVDLRDGTFVPLDAVGVWIVFFGKTDAVNKYLVVDSADTTPDGFSSRLTSTIPNGYLSDSVMVRLGTGANAGKVKIKALTGDWDTIWAWPVGWWK